ncbi:hypothetical protein [Brevibacillus borstelensis]
MKQEKMLKVRWDACGGAVLSGSLAEAEAASKSSCFREHLRVGR